MPAWGDDGVRRERTPGIAECRGCLSLEGRDVTEQTGMLFVGLADGLHVGQGQALCPAAGEAFKLLLGFLQLLAKNVDAFLVASFLSGRSDRLRRGGAGLRGQVACEGNLSHEGAQQEAGGSSAFQCHADAVSIPCVHGRTVYP